MVATATKAPHKLHQTISAKQGELLNSRAKNIAFIGGVGSAKTYGGAMWSARQALLLPHVVGFIGANSHRQLNQATLPTFAKVLELWKVPYLWNKQPPHRWGRSRFSTHSGILSIMGADGMTQIICRSLTNYDDIRGVEIGWAWLDETRDTREEAFEVIVGRMRGFDSEAKASAEWALYRGLITTTPSGFNWLHQRFIKDGEKALPGRQVVHATSMDNPFLPPGYVERLRAQYGAKLYQQEVMGRFVNLTMGQAYDFDRAAHVRPHIAYDDTLPLVHSWDFNVNPLCSSVAQVQGRELHWIDEIHVEGSGLTSDAANEFLSRYRHHKGRVIVTGDRSGDSRTTSTPETDWKMIAAAYRPVFNSRLSMQQNYSNPTQADRVNDVNTMLRNMAGDVRMYFDEGRCQFTIQDMEQQGWKPGTRSLDKSNPAIGHHGDAVGYAVSRLFPCHRGRGGGFDVKGL